MATRQFDFRLVVSRSLEIAKGFKSSPLNIPNTKEQATAILIYP